LRDEEKRKGKKVRTSSNKAKEKWKIQHCEGTPSRIKNFKESTWGGQKCRTLINKQGDSRSDQAIAQRSQHMQSFQKIQIGCPGIFGLKLGPGCLSRESQFLGQRNRLFHPRKPHYKRSILLGNSVCNLLLLILYN